ncbi:MAG: PLP-dependent transferase [Oscillospiraceae bacterium]
MFAKDFGNAAFILRLRTCLLRDGGACLSPFNAFLILQGIETLSLRMRQHSANALAVAEFLEKQPQVKAVHYPGLASSPYGALAQKYLPNGAGAVFTCELAGGREAAVRFIDALRLFSIVANVGDVRSLVIHPGTTTHGQLSDEQLSQSGIAPGTVRFSIGIEDSADLIDDLKQALAKSRCNRIIRSLFPPACLHAGGARAAHPALQRRLFADSGQRAAFCGLRGVLRAVPPGIVGAAGI